MALHLERMEAHPLLVFSVKSLAGKSKKKKRKPVKKNTLYRNFRARVLRLERRQQAGHSIAQADTTERTCHHCGTQYTGRYCPQCGLAGRWNRFTWRQLFLNFMDIWGLGNRPMFRSLVDLFWRPGYMMREYLGGHHLSFFPPFKLLALLTVLLVSLALLLKIPMEKSESVASIVRNMFDGDLSSTTLFLLSEVDKFSAYLDEHMLYNVIIQNVFVVLAVWFAFRKISRYNLVETFFSQIYIHCQFQVLAIISMLFTWRISHNSLFPYAVDGELALLVLTYDFHQLYDLKWKKAFLKSLRVAFNLAVLTIAFNLLFTLVAIMIEFITNPSARLSINEIAN